VFVVGDKSLQARLNEDSLLNQFPGVLDLGTPDRDTLVEIIDKAAKLMQDEGLAELYEHQLMQLAPQGFFPETPETKNKQVHLSACLLLL
jgi:hypothetical protein